jgi:hypothetical protein
VVHWSSFFEWDEATVAEAARADLVIFPIERCFSPLAEDIIADMRDINPELKIAAYIPVLNVEELPPETSYIEEYLPWVIEYSALVRDSWAMTTTGDTLHVWPGRILLNPIAGGGAGRDLIEGIVDLIEEHIGERPWAIDGLMHDYFMYRPYVSPYNTNVTGDIDLDGDGTPIGDDEDERERFLRWQKDYAAEIRSRFGADFIQIANGKVPQEDAELAGYLNGIFYELFPNMCWGVTDREGLQALLENQADGWLEEAHGRTWSILTNNSIEYNNMFCLLSSMLAGCFYTELHGDFVFRGWTIDIEAGRAESALRIEGMEDSIMTYSRSFSGGETVISFHPGGGRREWSFNENN